jgi:hypothetical protein
MIKEGFSYKLCRHPLPKKEKQGEIFGSRSNRKPESAS